MRRRTLTVAGFLSGAAGALLLYRRGGGRGRERVDLYFDDGSMVSLAEGSPGAVELLPLARRILETARNGSV